MKKSILLWLLAVAILAAGCTGRVSDAQQTTAATTKNTTAAATADTQAEVETTAAPETTSPEETQAQQTEPADTNDELDDYMASLEAQAADIKAALEQAQSQSEMNQKAHELYVLWDDALNELWGKLQDSLPEDEFDELLDEQIQWIEDKENAVEEAGKEVEGGSMYPLITNTKAAETAVIQRFITDTPGSSGGVDLLWTEEHQRYIMKENIQGGTP